jgi:hypothetical protein
MLQAFEVSILGFGLFLINLGLFIKFVVLRMMPTLPF